MACFNKSHPVFKELVKTTGVNPDLLAIKVEAWMQENNTSAFPTAQQLGLKPTTPETPQQAKARILKRLNANSQGFISPFKYNELLQLIGDYNRSMKYKALDMPQAMPARGKQQGDYYITIQKPYYQIDKKTTSIRPGVKELFDSNPELANAVYSALGFKQKQYASKLKEISERRKLATKSDLENSQLIKDIRVDKTQPKELKPNAADNNLAAIMLYGMKMSELKDKGLFEEIGEATTLAYRILNDLLFDINEIIEFQDVMTPEYAGALTTNENPVKEFFENDIFEQVEKDKFQITPQQKQQAQQLYSQYLDTIFLNSKVKDIVYHGTPYVFEEFDISKAGAERTGGHLAGASFTNNPDLAFSFADSNQDLMFLSIKEAQEQLKNAKEELEDIVSGKDTVFDNRPEAKQKYINDLKNLIFGFEMKIAGKIRPHVITAVVNLENPKVVSETAIVNQEKLKSDEDGYIVKDTGDDPMLGFIEYTPKKGVNEYIIPKTSQIHILGSKQDIKGFKKFISRPNFQLESKEKELPDQELKDKLLAFAEANGISVMEMQTLLQQFSKTGNMLEGATGVAMLLDKIIGIDPSKERLDTLAEEIAHFATAFMANDPSVKRAMALVSETEEYQEVKKEYAGVYKTEEQFKKEALDKILTKAIISKFKETKENKGILPYLKAIFNKFWRKVNKMKTSSAREQIERELMPLAQSILEGQQLTESDTVLPNETYYQSPETTNPEKVTEETAKKQKVSFVNKAIAQMEQRLSDLIRESRNKKTSDLLTSQIKNLKKQIEENKFDAAVLKTIEIASAEIKQLEVVLDKYKEDNKLLSGKKAVMIDNFALMYQELFQEFGNYIKDQNITYEDKDFNLNEEIKNIESRIGRVVSRNNLHIKQIRINASIRGNTDANGNPIDENFNPEEEAKIVEADASWWRFLVGNYKFAKSTTVRLVHKLIVDSVKSVKRFAVGVSNELLIAQKELEAAGYKVEDLVERDSKGIPSQFLIRDRDYNTYFKELRKIQDSIAEQLGAESFFDINRASLSEKELAIYKETFKKFFKEHTIKTIDAQGNEITIPRAVNPKFRELMSVPAVKNYYDLLLSKIKEGVDKLPSQYRTTNAYYKIPGIRKQFLERLSDQNEPLLQRVKNLTVGAAWKEAVSKDEDDTQFGDLRQLNNKVIPVFFTKTLSNPLDLSLDLTRSVTLFAEMAENFKTMSQLGPELLTIQKGLAEKEYVKGKFKKQKMDGNQSMDYKILDVMIDQFVYGIAKKDVEITIGGKTFSASKIIDKLTGYIRTNNLALNLTTSIAGYLKGSVDSILEDIVGQYSTMESKNWARQEYFKNLPEVSTEILSHQKNNKMHLMLQLANIIELSKTLKNTNKSKFISEALSKDLLFINYKTADYAIKGRTTLAILDNNRLYNGKFYNKLEFTNLLKKQNKTEKEINELWKTLQDKSFYNAFEVVNKKLVVKKEFESVITEGIQNKIFSQVEHVTNIVDGTISETDRGALSRTIYGQFPLMHRGWFINTIDTRFRKERVNFLTGQTEIGMYNATFGKLLWEEIHKKRRYLQPRLAYKELNPAEQKAVLRTGVDLLFLTIIGLLAGVVNAAADDDDNDSFMLQYLAYQLNRVLLEQKASWSLKETIEMIDEPVVGVRTIKELLDITEAFNFGEEYESGMYEGHSHATKWWVRKVPGFKSLYELQFPEMKNRYLKNQVVDSRTYKIIKEIKGEQSDWSLDLGSILGLKSLKNMFSDRDITVKDIQVVDEALNSDYSGNK